MFWGIFLLATAGACFLLFIANVIVSTIKRKKLEKKGDK